jgi:mannosyltransferase
MTNPLSSKEKRKFWLLVPGSRLIFAIILLVGLFLRLYQISAQPFWFDEIGVAEVATQPDVSSVVRTTAWHVMAMPLDYIVRWLFGQVSASDGFLRLPSAIFGTLTLPVAYLLFRRLSNARVALLAVFLLAISPIHIDRSQELRFYASMILFYLLSTHLLLIAVETGRGADWLRFIAAAAVGLFFHVYVLIALVHGAVFLAVQWLQKRLKLPSLRWFASSSMFLIALFFSAYVFLIAQDKYSHGINDFSPVLPGIASGLGWLVPFVQPGSPILWLGAIFPALGLAAIAFLFTRRLYSPNLVLLLSIVLQIAFVLLADELFNYYFVPRQLTFLTPFTYYFASLGLFSIHDRLKSIRLRQPALPSADIESNSGCFDRPHGWD